MTLKKLMAVVAICVLPLTAWAQNGPLRIEITEGVVEPMPFAAPNFVAESGAANEFAERLARVVVSDLAGTGLFREVPRDAYISQITSFDAP
ncbi:MAG: Tol-Pal system protein TolB, partial [Planktotalea sp.]|nr:Tol-Pal system protein TolB [Planktotalea sp.]